MTSLGFENYAEALKIYLSKYREVRDPVSFPSSPWEALSRHDTHHLGSNSHSPTGARASRADPTVKDTAPAAQARARATRGQKAFSKAREVTRATCMGRNPAITGQALAETTKPSSTASSSNMIDVTPRSALNGAGCQLEDGSSETDGIGVEPGHATAPGCPAVAESRSLKPPSQPTPALPRLDYHYPNVDEAGWRRERVTSLLGCDACTYVAVCISMGYGLREETGRTGRRGCTLKTTRESAVLSFKSGNFLRHSFPGFWFIAINNVVDFLSYFMNVSATSRPSDT